MASSCGGSARSMPARASMASGTHRPWALVVTWETSFNVARRASAVVSVLSSLRRAASCWRGGVPGASSRSSSRRASSFGVLSVSLSLSMTLRRSRRARATAAGSNLGSLVGGEEREQGRDLTGASFGSALAGREGWTSARARAMADRAAQAVSPYSLRAASKYALARAGAYCRRASRPRRYRTLAFCGFDAARRLAASSRPAVPSVIPRPIIRCSTSRWLSRSRACTVSLSTTCLARLWFGLWARIWRHSFSDSSR